MVVYAGVFETEDKAKEAFAKLGERGLEGDEVFIVTPADGPAKVKSIVSARGNSEFEGMINRMSAAVEGGHTVVGARPRLFFARQIDEAFEEVGAAKVITHSGQSQRFFSQLIGLSMTFRSRPRVTTWKRQVLGKTGLYKRPVTEKFMKMLSTNKHIIGMAMISRSGPLTERMGLPLIFSEIKKSD